MFPIRLTAAAMAACVTVLLTAAPAPAKPRGKAALKATVVGQPYVATSSKSAIPVLVSKETARRAGLRSPVGVVIVPRRKAVPTPDGAVLPGQLRFGDRFRTVARISKQARRAVYARISLRSLEVYRRAKTLSTAELQALLDQTNRDVADLKRRFGRLADYMLGRFAGYDGDISQMRADLKALTADFEALTTRVNALETALAALQSSIDAQLAALAGDVAGLQSALDTLTGRVAALETQLDGLLPRVSALEDGLATLTGRVDTLFGEVGSLKTTVDGLLSRVSALEATVTSLNATVGDLGNRLTTLEAAVTTLADRVTTLEQTVGLLCGDPLITVC